jgi:hypothetical protein
MPPVKLWPVNRLLWEGNKRKIEKLSKIFDTSQKPNKLKGEMSYKEMPKSGHMKKIMRQTEAE